jgi:hypothetical protein
MACGLQEESRGIFDPYISVTPRAAARGRNEVAVGGVDARVIAAAAGRNRDAI